MDDITLRNWAERFDPRLQGALTQYLLGNTSLEQVLIPVVERLYPRHDLSDVMTTITAKVKELDPDSDGGDVVDFLEKLVGMLESKSERAQPALFHTQAPVLGEPGLLTDRQIRELVKTHGMIDPFHDGQITHAPDPQSISKLTISYGLSSCGYDVRVDRTFKVFTEAFGCVIDPKAFDSKNFVEVTANDEGFIRLPPHGFALGKSVERFNIPRNILVDCRGKSTYARCGIVANLTPMEPEWEGHATLALSNTSPAPVKVYAGEGAAQFLFFRTAIPCEVSYKDRGGKYQGATDSLPPKMKGYSFPSEKNGTK